MKGTVVVMAATLVPGLALASAWEPVGLGGFQVTGLLSDGIGSTGTYASTLGEGVYVTHDSVSTWQSWNSGLGNAAVTSLSYVSPFGEDRCPYLHVHAGTPSGVWRRWTEDPGVADSIWQPFNNELADPYVTAIGSDETGVVVCGTQSGELFRYNWLYDAHWHNITSPLFGPGPILSVSVGWDDVIFVVSHGGQSDSVYRSLDGGESWEADVIGASARVVDASGWHPSGGLVWIGCSGGAVAVSTDCGDSWTLTHPFPSFSTCTCFLRWYGGSCWAGADSGGVMRTDDGGVTWTKEGGDLAAVLCLEKWGDTLLAGTAAGVYKLGCTSADDPKWYRPLSLSVRPNPSRDGPWIELLLPEATSARVGIYDVVGRRLSSLCGGRLSGGAHILACGDGQPLTPGVYVCVANADGRKASCRFVVASP